MSANAVALYERRIHKLSEASVRKHFDAYADIAWDAPENRIDRRDPRWHLDPDDPLGATQWYQQRHPDQKALIGLDVIATKMKVGAQFEHILCGGLLQLASTMGDDNPEHRYAMHELIEEAQHILMFREFIRRTGLRVQGLRPWELLASRRVPRIGRVRPEQFFLHVLAGELPIDYVQRQTLARGPQLHPLLSRVLRIHVTEEARHVSFATSFLRERVPRLGRAARLGLAVKTPFILRTTAESILRPTERLIREQCIPRAVVCEAYGQGALHLRNRTEGLRTIRELCAELGLIPRPMVPVWRALGIWA